MLRREHIGGVAQETGSALVELAFVFPMLVILLAGLADFPRVFFWDMELTTAARAGVQYGSYVHASASSNLGNVATEAANASPQLSNVGAKPLKSGSIVVTKQCSCADLASGAMSALASCTTACNGRVVGTLTVRAPATFAPVFPMPFLPNPYKLGADPTKPQATMRLVP